MNKKTELDMDAKEPHETVLASPANPKTIPWSMKILSVLLVSLIGFGSHWSSGVTGAMKSTLKKVPRYYLLP